MKRSELKQIIREELKKLREAGGQDAGKLEIASADILSAITYLGKLGIANDINNFGKNFSYAKKIAHLGQTKRNDMPVITSKDVRNFQFRLKHGTIDINAPFAKTTNLQNPWPHGLSGEEAVDFLQRGLKDGSKKDDIISVSNKKIKIGKLKPIQKQIYLDKAIDNIARTGVSDAEKFVSNKTVFIVSKDNFIIDGHHRWLMGMLLDPNMLVNVVSIDLPISKLLPIATSYGDAIGNIRNN